MSSYSSIEAALEDWFENPMDQLPDDLRNLVESAFRSTPWDQLTPEKRRARAEMWDGYHDPSNQEEQRRLWELALRMDALENQIAELEDTLPVSVSEIELKKRNLEELKSALESVAGRFWSEKSRQTRTDALKSLMMAYLDGKNGGGDFSGCLRFLLKDPLIEEGINGSIIWTDYRGNSKTTQRKSLQNRFNELKKNWEPGLNEIAFPSNPV